MPYRIEASPNNRAGCSNKECKDEKVKITKGDIRVGTWVETQNYQSWSWRHWGCTTPLVLSHIIKDVFEKDEVTGDEKFDLIDGWEDLPEADQETVRNALIEGHVADDAWKGDPECNRPGMRGFRLAGKKKAAAKEADSDGEGEEAKPAKEVKKAASAKNKKSDEKKSDEKADTKKTDGDKADDEKISGEKANEDEKPVRRNPRAKKTATPESAENETAKSSAKAKRANRAKAAPKEDADAETQPAKRRGRPAKSAGAAEGSTKPAAKGTKRKVSVNDEQDETTVKPKRGRKKAVPEKETDVQEAAPEKPKRGRKTATKE